MNFNENDYIKNSVVHDLVDQLIKDPTFEYKVSIDETGRKWKVGNQNYSQNEINGSERGVISQLFSRAYVSIMSLFSSEFREKFDFAISIINVKNANADKLAKNVDTTAQNILNNQKAKIAELKSLRSELNDAQDQLQQLTDRFEEIQKPVQESQDRINLLKKAYEPGFLPNLEDLLTRFNAKQNEVEKLYKAKREADILLENKRKPGPEGWRPIMLVKDEKALEEEKEKADLNLQVGREGLQEIHNEISRELTPLSIEFPAEGLKPGNCKHFFDDKIIELQNQKMIAQDQTNKDWVDLELKIRGQKEDVANLEHDCAEKEREIIELGGEVPPPEEREFVPEEVGGNNRVLDLESVEEAEEGSSVHPVDLAAELIQFDDFPNINHAVSQIQQKTGSTRLANVWARLLGKFGEEFGDIVQSVNVGAGGDITINLKPVQGKKPDEQYRMWIPSSKNEQGVVEPEGGIVILLGNKIVLKGSNNKLEVKEGYQNFVRVPQWARKFGEYNSANTSLMEDLGNGEIKITVAKKILFLSIEKSRNTPHARLDHNWGERGEVITDNTDNIAVIKSHDNDYIADE